MSTSAIAVQNTSRRGFLHLPAPENSFHRMRTPSTACGRSPSLEEGGMGVRKSNVCGISAGARCAPLQRGRNRNGEMRLQRWVLSLQQLVAPPYPVWARIARPFVPDVITTTLREGARRVIGATAKPLYPIDGKAVGLDRRIPQDLPLRGRGTARGRWKEFSDDGRRLKESPHQIQTDAPMRVRRV